MNKIKRFRTIEHAYGDWWQTVAGPDFTEIQVTEMRYAFYRGAWALLEQFMQFDDDMPEEVGAAQVELLRRELLAYLDSVSRDERA